MATNGTTPGATTTADGAGAVSRDTPSDSRAAGQPAAPAAADR